jgi:hypothetical protein
VYTTRMHTVCVHHTHDFILVNINITLIKFWSQCPTFFFSIKCAMCIVGASCCSMFQVATVTCSFTFCYASVFSPCATTALIANTFINSSSSAVVASALMAMARAKSASQASSISASMVVKCWLVRNVSMDDRHKGHVEPRVANSPSKHSLCIKWLQDGSLTKVSTEDSPQFREQGQPELCRTISGGVVVEEEEEEEEEEEVVVEEEEWAW